MTVEHCITLVHGTFAPNAAWTKPTHWLARTVELNLHQVGRTGPGSVAWCPFKWSGANLHSARTQGGIALEQQLRQQVTAYPDARHLVIAHSHGGNVALMALRDTELQRRIAAVVTLNTPFLRGSVRSISGLVVGLPALMLILWPLALSPLFYDLLIHGEPQGLRTLGMTLATLIAAIGVTSWLARRFDATRRKQRIAAAARNIGVPPIEHTRVICLTSASDEVDDAFQLFTALTSGMLMLMRIQVVLALWALLALAHEIAFQNWQTTVLPGLQFLPGLTAPFKSLPPPPLYSPQGMLRVVPWMVSSSCLVLTVLLVVQLLSWLRLRFMLGVDGLGLADAIYVRAVSSVVPPTARNIAFKEIDVGAGDALNHSLSYEDDVVLREIWRVLCEDQPRSKEEDDAGQRRRDDGETCAEPHKAERPVTLAGDHR